MKNSDTYELIQSCAVEDDWTEEEYHIIVEDPELLDVINYRWEQELKNNRLKEVAINKVNTAGYPEFRAFLLQEIMEKKHLATDIMFEYAASQKWMIARKKQFQPTSYMERAFGRNGDLVSKFREHYSHCPMPKDFRVIRPDAISDYAEEVKNTIVREYLISSKHYSKPENKAADFFRDSIKWTVMAAGIVLIAVTIFTK